MKERTVLMNISIGTSLEGKNQLTIGMGCTGGRHRSVYMAERLYEYLKEKKNLTVLKNRDMDKEARNV